MHDAGPRAEPPPVGGEAGHAAPAEHNPNQNAVGPNDPPPAEAPAEIGVYTPSVAEGAVRCCEILSGISQRRQSFESLRAPEPELETILHPLCIVISQDCDLEQDFCARRENRATPLADVLLCDVVAANDLKGNVAQGRDIWKRIIQNKDERYQFLRAVQTRQDLANEGLTELGIDFRRCFSVPTDELYEQFSLGARRRCRLSSPFKEHLMNRLAHFIARVGLPYDHHVERPG